MRSCNYVECVNVPDILIAGSRFGMPLVLTVKIIISVLRYRHANEADKWKENARSKTTSMHHVLHIVVDIEPSESVNISSFVALELTHASPHRVWLKEVAL